MAGTLRITNDGKILVNGLTMTIADLVFKTTNDLVDIGGTSVLNRVGLVGITEFNNTKTLVNNNVATIAEKADITYVNGILNNKANISDVVLKSELSTIQTATPVVTGPTGINEGNDGLYTITNYNSSFIYDITTTAGTLVDNGNGTFTITAKDVSADSLETITITATEPGKLKSNALVINVTVVYVAMVADQTLSNASYVTNVYINDGYQL